MSATEGRDLDVAKALASAGGRHGSAAGFLRNLLAHPLTRNLDLDSHEATEIHARLIREKPFLRRLYEHYYSHYDAAVARAAPGGLIVEIGSGGGFYRELRRGVCSIDVRPGASVNVVASALSMPFTDRSVSAILMLNVLHHLPDVKAFFSECRRTLTPGGRVCLIEPYVSPLSRLIVKPLHHEPWDENGGWGLPASGPMTGANMALPSIVFMRDRAEYDRAFPDLPVDRVHFHTMALYLLSGGVSMRALVPSLTFRPLLATERLLARAGRTLASMMTVELVRR